MDDKPYDLNSELQTIAAIDRLLQSVPFDAAHRIIGYCAQLVGARFQPPDTDKDDDLEF